jgi:membrane protease YdiL (CAAX protease family)
VLLYLVLFAMLSHGAESQTSPIAFLAPLLLCCALFGLNRIYLRAEGLSLTAIGLGHSSPRLLFFALGFGGGLALIALWAVLMTFCMDAHWHTVSPGSLGGILVLLLFTFFLAGSEEFAYRGYAMVRLSHSLSPLAAILITSAVFTLLHIQGGMPWLNAVAGVFTCAVLYAVLFDRTRSLPLVLGFHAANNLAQNILGLRASPLALLRHDLHRPSGGTLTLALMATANLGLAALLWRLLPAKPARS